MTSLPRAGPSCPWPTSDVRVFQHEQEAVAEGGAAGLRAGKEERQHGDDEVLVVELAARVGLLLCPQGRGRGRNSEQEPGPCFARFTPAPCSAF